MTFLADLAYRVDRWAMTLLLGEDPLDAVNKSYRPRSDADALAASFRASDQRVRW